MPNVTLASLVAEEGTAVVATSSGDLTLKFRKGQYTPELLSNNANVGFEKTLADLLIEWDLMWNGPDPEDASKNKMQPYPTDWEHLKKLPTSFINDCLQAILEAVIPNARASRT
jgi:hypothetical protein